MNFRANQYKIIFYEKTGCGGNARQKKLLSLQGVSFETRSLLDTVWTQEELNSFFHNLKKEDIVNSFAPKIKNGDIDIDNYTKDELINLMIDEPILIKRPLLQIGENKLCGFDIEKINKFLNSEICEDISISTCQSADRDKCI